MWKNVCSIENYDMYLLCTSTLISDKNLLKNISTFVLNTDAKYATNNNFINIYFTVITRLIADVASDLIYIFLSHPFHSSLIYSNLSIT